MTKEEVLIFMGESWLQIITGIGSDRVVLEYIFQSPGYLGSVPLLAAKQKAEPSTLKSTWTIYMFPIHM